MTLQVKSEYFKDFDFIGSLFGFYKLKKHA